jgi:hypothetical protein
MKRMSKKIIWLSAINGVFDWTFEDPKDPTYFPWEKKAISRQVKDLKIKLSSMQDTFSLTPSEELETAIFSAKDELEVFEKINHYFE